MKRNKLIAMTLSVSMVVPTATASFVVTAANEDPLKQYAQILEEFNVEYGTSYQFATEQQLKSIGCSRNEIEEFYSTMDEDEFRDHLFKAYQNDRSKKLALNEDVCSDTADSESANSPTVYNIVITDNPMNSGTQRYYYHGTSSEYLSLSATWSYGDGYYRYSPYIQGMGYGYTPGNFPYYVPYATSHSLQNLSREMFCSYTCDKFIDYGLTDLTVWTVNVTFTAGGGDIWNSIVI